VTLRTASLMPTKPARPSLPSRLHRALVSQKTGVVCAFAAAALLGLGSFVADRRPDVYGGLAFDDLRFFFHPWRPAHVWLYALVVVFALWAASTLLCTWDTAVARVRGRVLRPSAWGSSLVHLSFVLALGAHLWAGLGAESRMHVVGSAGTEIGGARYRVLDVEQKSWPNGMPREAKATLERTAGGTTSTVTVGFNQPIVEQAGARELLLGRYGRARSGTVMRIGGELLPMRPGELVVTLQQRDNPSVPLVLAVAGLLTLGVVLAAWERLRRDRRKQEPG